MNMSLYLFMAYLTKSEVGKTYVDLRIILKWILVKQDGGIETGLILPVARSCEHGNEPSSSIKCGIFLEWLSDCWLIKNDSALWT
jgi:hypothetical protein